MTNPKISVVIPAYNSDRFIADAINSVFEQKIDNIEIIIIDDGSTDNTNEIVAKFGDKVSYFRQKNKGASCARNFGVNVANGTWIAFLDSDDSWSPNYLEHFLSIVNYFDDVALYYCGKIWVDEFGKPLLGNATQKIYPQGWILNTLLMNNYISSCSCVIVRKDIYISIGGFNEDPIFCNGEDYDLWLRIASNYRICSIPFPYVRYRRHSHNLTNNSSKYEIGHLAALKNAILYLQRNAIHPNNQVQKTKLRAIMKKAYSKALISLFYLDDYDMVKKISLEAIMQGYISIDIFIRCITSFMPKSFIHNIKDIKRTMNKSRF